MATARLRLHCGTSICFHAVLVSHSQKICAVNMSHVSRKRTAMIRRGPVLLKVRVTRTIEKRIESRADLSRARESSRYGREKWVVEGLHRMRTPFAQTEIERD
jgi:hypothetical protein